MKVKDFIQEGNKLFIAESYGNDKVSNEEYDLIVETWERLRMFLEWTQMHTIKKEEKK